MAAVGFNRRKMEDERRRAAEKEAARRACRSCRPNAPFAELVRLSPRSIADEMREEHRGQALGE